MCTSTTLSTDLIVLSDTEDFLANNARQAAWVADQAGVVTGFVTALIAGETGPIAVAIGGTVWAAVSSWLEDVLTVSGVHCGDRLVTEITICPRELHPVEVFEDVPVRVQAIDTRIEHLHSRCIDDFATPPPPGTELQSISSSSPELQFEFTLNGVTHAFEEQPSEKEIKKLAHDIRRQKSRKNSFDGAGIDDQIIIDAGARGIETGFRLYEELYGLTDDK